MLLGSGARGPRPYRSKGRGRALRWRGRRRAMRVALAPRPGRGRLCPRLGDPGACRPSGSARELAQHARAHLSRHVAATGAHHLG